MPVRGPILNVQKLWKSFGAIPVLRGVSLSVNRSEIVIIIGPSGSGKTTLLRCIDCLEFPDRGRIEVNDVPFGRSGPPEFDWRPDSIRVLERKRRSIGFVFQKFHLFANLSALDNVLVGPTSGL